MSRRGGQSGGAAGARSRAGARPMYEDFRPISEWKHEEQEQQQSHILLVHLPGFAKEQIKVSTEGTNTLRIRGERQVGGNKWNRFDEDFRIPQDCNIRGIRAMFEAGTLTITMPKNPPTTATQVSPKRPQDTKTTQVLKPPFEGPSKQKDYKKLPVKLSEQEIKERREIEKPGEIESPNQVALTEIVEKPKESKERGKESIKDEKFIDNIVKKEEEEGKGKGKESTKDENIKENRVKEGKELGGKGFIEEMKKKGKKERGEGKAKEMEGGSRGSGGGDGVSKMEKYKQTAKGIAKGERELMVNMGVAAVVLMALGAYISYTFSSSGEA